MMEVQMLVLETPCDAWPSVTDLVAHRACAAGDADANLIALIAASSSPQTSASSSVVGLSRIGLSVFLLAKWRWSGGAWCAEVRNPLNHRMIAFPILECVPRDALPSRPMRGRPNVDGERIVFCAAASSMRIALCPRSLHAAVPRNTLPGRSTEALDAPPALVHWLRAAWERDGEPLEHWISTLVEHIHQTHSHQHGGPSFGSGAFSFGKSTSTLLHGGYCGILLHGPSGVGKSTQVERLLRLVAAYPIATAGGGQSSSPRATSSITTRVVHVSKLFEQTNHMTDPASLLVQALQPPISDPSCDAQRTHVVFLDGVDVLGGGSLEPFVLVAIHAVAQWLEQRLRHRIDDISTSSRQSLVIISAATDASLVHPMLRCRSALQTVSVEATPPSEALRRYVYTQHRLKQRNDAEPAAAAAAWLETTAGWTMAKVLHNLDTVSTMAASTAAQAGPPSIAAQVPSPLKGLVGVDHIVLTLEQLLLRPLRHQRDLERIGVQCPKGALIVGPSGSGKTALLSALYRELSVFEQSATAVVSTAAPRLHVVMVDALSLLQKEVGQSEKNIQMLLAEARASAPSVVFIDNLEAIAPPRGGEDAHETNITADRTLSTLLAELDGVREHKKPLLVVASAPSVASLDAAMTRPGRLDLHIALTLPSADSIAKLIATRLGAEFQHACGASSADALSSDFLLDVVRSAMQGAMRPLTYADAVSAARAAVLGVCSNAPNVATALRCVVADAAAEGDDAAAAVRGAVSAFVRDALLAR